MVKSFREGKPFSTKILLQGDRCASVPGNQPRLPRFDKNYRRVHGIVPL